MEFEERKTREDAEGFAMQNFYILRMLYRPLRGAID
jgi:hypothetical protein